MSVDQLPARVREFVNYLDGLIARLDQGGGWCGVFWQRDPEGMRACLEGREVPPWDVVESLLHDLAAQYGPGGTGPETERARSLHAAALAAYDARPGGRDDLGDRLDVMLREQRYAAERQAELGRLLASATTHDQVTTLRLDLAWAQDDHDRATARCAELRSRMADLDRREASARGQAIRRDRAAEGAVFRVEDGGGGYGAGGGRFEDGGVGGVGYEVGVSGEEWFGAGGRPAPGGPVGRSGPLRATAAADWPTAPQSTPAPAASGDPEPLPSDTPAPATPSEPAPTKQRKRRRGSARFAGMAEEETAPVLVPPTGEGALPTLPAQAGSAPRTPRGARFAGADAEVDMAPERARAEVIDPDDRREVGAVVEALVRLRGEGRSGEAHVLLVEAAYWPAVRFPLLAAEMQRAGLGADWATLLWEAASLPAERLVAAADALTAAGRAEDGEQILRQGVLRPAPEIGQAVLGLSAEGRRREVRALLDAYVRMRTPEEAARSVAPDPKTLVPLLLEAAQGISDERHWDLVHALRVAGFTT